MIKLKSLNARLLIAFSALSTIICLFFTLLSVLLVEQARDNAFHQFLTAEAEQISQRFAKHGEVVMGDTPYLTVFEDEQDVLKAFPSVTTTLINHFGTIVHTGSFLVLKHPLDKATPIWLAIDLEKLHQITPVADYMMLFLYSISAGVIILTLLSSWYLAKLLSSPISSLTQGVLEKAQTSNNQIYGHQRSDEIGTLAKAFDKTFDSLQSALNREQNFTRDVSHELRTPITLIKNALALHQNKPIEKEATKVIEQASQELEQTVEVLLALARQENVAFESCAILPIVEKTILAIYTSYPELAFDVRTEISPQLKVNGNPYLISLLCQNLVNNGFYHGNDGGMTIKSEDNVIIFENNIDGQQERPYYQGLGHGQYLVKRIAEVMGWKIKVIQTSKVYRVIVQAQT